MSNVEVKSFFSRLFCCFSPCQESYLMYFVKRKMENAKRTYDLENRLIEFSVLIISIAEGLYKTKAGNHISGQIVRSGTAPALYYGEAQGAESRADFLHKIKIILKELRETRIALLIIKKTPLSDNVAVIESGLDECTQLIAIFRKSSETAQRNQNLA